MKTCKKDHLSRDSLLNHHRTHYISIKKKSFIFSERFPDCEQCLVDVDYLSSKVTSISNEIKVNPQSYQFLNQQFFDSFKFQCSFCLEW